MALLETSRVLEDEPLPESLLREVKTPAWKPSAIASDIATLGAGTLLAGVINAALVFVIPKLVSVEDYGYWRLFGLYGGYVGFLHFGFADGALLRWAGRPLREFHGELRPALKYMLWQHAVVLTVLCAIVVFVLPGPLRVVGIGVAIYALVFNHATLLQYALQSARIFRPVAIATVTAPILLLLSVLMWHRFSKSDYREVICLCVLSWGVVLAFLFACTRPFSGTATVRAAVLAKKCLLSGWPIVMANTGVMLIAFADRLVVSWAATIQNFAQYSLAASAMAVPITAIQACNRVFFSHLAAVTDDARKRLYGISARTLLIAWAVLLPYYFVLNIFIHRFLPRYIPSLHYARILLLGIPFLAAVQILQMSYAYLNGMQKRFLAQTITVLAISLSATSFAAFHAGSLQVVAEVQVGILGCWWLFNEFTLRNLTEERLRDWIKFAAMYAIVSLCYWGATSIATEHMLSAVSLYYGLFVTLLALFCRAEVRSWAKLLADKQMITG